jgi:ABC-type Fe3+ transport system permease subunit
MSTIHQSDALKNLVLFMIGLAIPGTIIALAWHFAVALPLRQDAFHTPVNSFTLTV